MTNLILTLLLSGVAPTAADAAAEATIPFQTLDLNVGESQEIRFGDNPAIPVTLIKLDEARDPFRSAVRTATVTVKVKDRELSLVSANYRLPIDAGGVQIDCPITRGYCRDSRKTQGGSNPWGLEKDARLRLWPAGAWIPSATFKYPAKQRWFASATQMANEPVYVDGGENPRVKNIYYHYGLDIGGTEEMVDVIAATDGTVVSAGKSVLEGHNKSPVEARYDVVYILDNRGWYYRYSHLHTIASAIKPGAKVTMGQPVGLLGKEGGSGGWSHLHFDITGKQPSGQWGIIDGYAFLWESYIREYQPKLIAVARPHMLAAAGEKVKLDGSRSWAASGKIQNFQWRFTDGTTAEGPTIERSYAKPGVYSEILKITDADGRIDYDFAIVNVLDLKRPELLPPTIHANYSPTFGIRANDPITFKVRTFRTTDGKETWDFGDGSPKVEVQSDGNAVQHAKDGYARTVHRYAKPGHYIVRVERTDRNGLTAIGHVQVRVGEE